ncbi:hypothetical protein [Rhabdothermincola salaria]|uniref:hypothetical protein n=1 Tax=Rhabdothermincola salaria TaxID=2903142 RepID=UPI001E3ED2E0|nr:hypothetical protein [Rhabdothermincola salaria]MCD9622640.1 hypothetical protein [Rhabdothermincola salaria]
MPGIGVLGVGGLLGVGVASAVGGAMLGGYLGIAAASEERDEHEALEHLPLQPGEVIVAVCSHGRRDDVEAAFERHGGRVIARGMPAIGS